MNILVSSAILPTGRISCRRRFLLSSPIASQKGSENSAGEVSWVGYSPARKAAGQASRQRKKRRILKEPAYSLSSGLRSLNKGLPVAIFARHGSALKRSLNFFTANSTRASLMPRKQHQKRNP